MGFNFPNAPSPGNTYTPVNGPTFTWDGIAWKALTQGVPTTVFVGDTAPPAPALGQMWWDSDSGNLFIWYSDGDSAQWVQVNGTPGGYQTAQARNRIVNGAMQVSQENGGTGGSVTEFYPADQWKLQFNGIAASSNRFSSLPTAGGSPHSLALGVNVAKPSLATGDYARIVQNIEGTRIADFQWGTANAKQIVVRFSVYAPVGTEGTYCVTVCNGTDYTRNYICTYTIAASDIGKFVWRTVVIPGDVAGTWPTDTSRALNIQFVFAAGSSYTVATPGVWQTTMFAPVGLSNGARVVGSFLIADVGLYLDPNTTGVAPPWVMPDEAEELRACLRYWTVMGLVVNSSAAISNSTLPAPMRIIPAATGGGAGFTLAATDTKSMSFYQTAVSGQSLAFNARM